MLSDGDADADDDDQQHCQRHGDYHTLKLVIQWLILQ